MIPDPTQITIQPWDTSILQAIEKALRQSDLDLNPQNDGKTIRVPIPQLNEERRKLLVKHAHKHAEEGRVAVRNVRRDSNEHVKKLLKDHEISEDDEKLALGEIQKLTDGHIAKIDETLKKKEAEIMEVSARAQRASGAFHVPDPPRVHEVRGAARRRARADRVLVRRPALRPLRPRARRPRDAARPSRAA